MEKSNVYQRRTRKGSKNKYNLAYTKMDMWSYYCNNRDKKKAIALRQDVYRKVVNAIMDGIMDKYLRLGRVSLGANIGFIELRKKKGSVWRNKNGEIHTNYPIDYKGTIEARKRGEIGECGEYIKIVNTGYKYVSRFASEKAKIKNHEYLIFRTSYTFRKRLHDKIVKGEIDGLI